MSHSRMRMTTASKTTDALISIVDDEPCVRNSLGRFMRSSGYRTKEYDSAEDFLTRGWWDEPACLILDVRLPAMGGLELQRYLASNNHSVRSSSFPVTPLEMSALGR